MRFGWRGAFRGAVVTGIVSWLGLASTAGQGGPVQPQMSETVFKNIQVLKGIPVDEFMDTMGMFASALGFCCSNCHSKEILTDRDAFAVATPQIQKARQMIVMMNTMNRTFFGGEQRLTCYTCHRGDFRPAVVPSLALQYSALVEDPNEMLVFSSPRVSATAVFDKYIQAIGGASRLASLTSFVATGTYGGFNTGGSDVAIEILARAPDQRTQIVRAPDGDSLRTFDGRNAWAAEGWRPVPLLQLTGGNLEGARLDAMMSFPAGVQKAFSEWRANVTTIDDRQVQILQGSNPGQLPVNFYFDESGLLIRMVRWNRTAVGTVPTQIDYGDYREVAGVRMPFRMVVTWTDGQNTIALKEVRPNVPIEAARFGRPAPFQGR